MRYDDSDTTAHHTSRTSSYSAAFCHTRLTYYCCIVFSFWTVISLTPRPVNPSPLTSLRRWVHHQPALSFFSASIYFLTALQVTPIYAKLSLMSAAPYGSNEYRVLVFLSVAVLLFVVSYFLKNAARYSFAFPLWSAYNSTDRTRERRVFARGLFGGRRLSRLSASNLGLMLTERDFTGEDFELLSRLDEGNQPRHLGATTAEIGRLPTYTFVQSNIAPQDVSFSDRNDAKCIICLESFEEGDINRILPCMHHFHRRCIDIWLLDNASCPVCKSSAVG